MIDLSKSASYDYFLPRELIATSPTIPPQNAKMLVYNRKNGEILHKFVKDLPEILPRCAIVFNDTKVIKARIYGHKNTGAKVEILLNAPLSDDKFSVFIKGRVKNGDEILLENGVKIQIIECFDDGIRNVKFIKNDKFLTIDEIYALSDEIGHMPIPPYIKRPENENDEIWYQSLFAKNLGSVAAPTASLHFSPNLIAKLRESHKIAFITLHIGAGTFKSVESDEISGHIMHSERYILSQNAQKLINSNEKILAIGTTVIRTIENFARTSQRSGLCDLFINPLNPPFRVDYFLTNFHLPKSTLIMLVAGFIGLEKTLELYKIAIKNEYKFYSYGDCMLVL